jgi:hypothetical protein
MTYGNAALGMCRASPGLWQSCLRRLDEAEVAEVFLQVKIESSLQGCYHKNYNAKWHQCQFAMSPRLAKKQ